jgi:hypothetical protein
MMQLFRSASIGAVLAAIVALGAARASAEAQTPWDQAKVGAIAKELVEAVEAVYDALREEPSSSVASGQARSFYSLTQNVRRIRTESRELTRALEGGQGHDETLPIYRQMLLLVRDAREEARRTFLTSPVSDRITAARGVLDRLAPYYDAEPPPPALPRN